MSRPVIATLLCGAACLGWALRDANRWLAGLPPANPVAREARRRAGRRT